MFTNLTCFIIPATSNISQMLAVSLEFMWCPVLEATLHDTHCWCSSEIREKSPDSLYLNYLNEKSNTGLLYQKCSMIRKISANFDYFPHAWKELNSSEE